MLSFAAMGVAGVVAVMACAPASPASQSGSGDKESPTATPIPTATPYPDDCVEFQAAEDRMEVFCPEFGPREIEEGLRRQYNALMAEKELATQEGGRSVVDAIVVKVLIKTSTTDAVDDVVLFLDENGGGVVGHSKDSGPHSAGRIVAYISIELLPAIIAIEGVGSVVEVHQDPPSGSNLHVGQGALTAVERMFVDHWHEAGVTGAGVEVAVIDADFRDFRTRVADPAVVNADPTKPDVHFFCYNKAGTTTHTDFSFCETASPLPYAGTPTPRPHGTDVAAALLEVAPDVTLYISNANDRMQLEEVVDWLTAKDGDNYATGVPYNNECEEDASDVENAGCNDNFDVKVINRSRVATWDGVGDGTSNFDKSMDRSPINVIADAVERGTLWVQAAGNGALRTWFDSNPTFAADNRLEFGQAVFGPTCNLVTLTGGTSYTFQLRWNGSWLDGNTGTEAFVRMELQSLIPPLLPRIVATGSQGRLGIMGRYPWREMTYTPTGTGTETYCIYVYRDPGLPEPSWVQLQMFSPDGTLDSASPVGSIDNPAESVNPGMLSVGAFTNASPPVIKAFSARGPLPASSVTKPDVNGLNTALLGTSFSAPRVAGMAALRYQMEGRTTPRVVARMLARVVHQEIAVLPDLAAPTNLTFSYYPCSDGNNLSVGFDRGLAGVTELFSHVKAVQVGVLGVVGGSYERYVSGFNAGNASFNTKTDRGAYDVTVKACITEGYCGVESSPPTRFTTTPTVCRPSWFSPVPGDGKVTLWWNPDPDATSYQVEDGDGNPVPASGGPLAGEEYVVEGLTNGTQYSYRVRALGPGGPSAWTSLHRVTPLGNLFRPEVPTALRLGDDNISRRYPGLSLKWDALAGDQLYEIKILGGGASDWKRLTFQPTGWNSPYSARFFGSFGTFTGLLGPNIYVGEAIISGLIPGTEYRVAVRVAMDRDSVRQMDRSPWSNAFSFTTPGVRPATAPGDATAPPLKAPAKDLMAVLDGTTVELSWTAATNPNYVRQVLFRRNFGVNPIQWTEIAVGLNDTTYTDAGLTSGITYRYRVRSYKQLVGGNYGESGHAEAVIP